MADKYDVPDDFDPPKPDPPIIGKIRVARVKHWQDTIASILAPVSGNLDQGFNLTLTYTQQSALREVLEDMDAWL